MKLIKVEESLKYLEKIMEGVENYQEALDRFIDFFENYKIKYKLNHKEEDMLLFQYGLYGWDGKEKQFSIDLTRQFEIPDEDEFLQLNFTFFYDPKLIGEIKAFNSWSVSGKNIEEWKLMIQNTEGFKKVANLKLNRREIGLCQT